MSCETMVVSPHVEQHQHDNRSGPSSISSLLNCTRACDPQPVSKEDRQLSPQPPPSRRESDQSTAVGSSSSDSTAVSPVLPYHHLPTPKSPAAPVPQHGYSNNNNHAPAKKHPPPPSSTKTTAVVHHYEMIPRSTEDTRSGIYASFSLKDTSPAARQQQHHSSKVISASTPRPFACTECDQTFSRAHNLKSHFATHSTARPFKCDVCAAKFRRLHDLKRHQRLHTGERPYLCSTCQRCFSRLDALNRHQRTEGGSACHYRRRNITPTINIETLVSGGAAPAPVAAPVAIHTPPQLELQQLQQQQRPNIPHLDLRHLSTNDRIILPSPSIHPHYIHQVTPSSSPPPPSSSLPEQQYHHRPSESPENYAALQAAYAQLYDQYRDIQEATHSRYQAKADEVESLRQSLYDLQVENRVLRSLVVERQPNKDDTMNIN